MLDAFVITVVSVVYIPFAVATALLGATRAHIANKENVRIQENRENVKIQEEIKRQTDIRRIVQNLDNILGINSYGTPYSEYGILHILKNKPTIDLSYIYDNDKTLLDISIDLSSIEAFNKILDVPNIPLETLLHSMNYLNETIVRLPKNKTRPQMKIILENKLKILEFDI